VKYRSRTDIVAEILRASLDGANKTKIMYRAFLSYLQLKSYLETLVTNSLLEYDEKSEIYLTSAKGKAFLKTLDTLNEVIRMRTVS
jgi:predicted transcriptional regulator